MTDWEIEQLHKSAGGAPAGRSDGSHPSNEASAERPPRPGPTSGDEQIHGYQETEVSCPYCGNAYGRRYRTAEGIVVYVCWCGAKKQETE